MTTAALETAVAVHPERPPAVWGHLAARSAAETVSGWLTPGLTGVYAVASVLIAFVGLAASGYLQVQDFGRTAHSLLAVTMWVVPLAAVLTGAIATSDDGELTMLLVQPVSWQTVFFARWVGAAAALTAGVAFAWGATGVIIGGVAGWQDGAGYLAVGGVALGCVLTGTALGAAAGAMAGRRTPAVVAALGLWFALAVAYGLAAVAVISISRGFGDGWQPALLAALDPFDALRVLGTLGVGGRELAFGAVTAARDQSDTTSLPWLLTASVAGWTIAALAIGAWRFARRDR